MEEKIREDAAKIRKELLSKIPKDQDEKAIQEEIQKIDDKSIHLEKAKELINQNYYDIIEILKKFIVMREDYYSIIALWIIGTYLHSDFKTYPYLFFNATKGSGKTRTLSLITSLSNNGQVMASPTEAVLFRTNGTLAIDEFERVANKDKSSIRELLNASYKKGIKVFRMKKKKSIEGEEQVVEEFEPYRPIIIANIWGMDDVLGDRCITMILEKSNDSLRTKLVEEFDDDILIKNIKNRFKLLNQCSLCSFSSIKNIYKQWNNYIVDKYKTTLTTYYTLTTLTTLTTLQQKNELKLDNFFNKIDASDLKGRDLELFLPIFLIGMMVGEKELKDTIEIAINLTKAKTKEENIENQDNNIIDFISDYKDNHFISVKNLLYKYKEYTGEQEDWMNHKWFGRALKRLNLILNKRRTYQGVEVIVNTTKAKSKIRMFKSSEENQKI